MTLLSSSSTSATASSISAAGGSDEVIGRRGIVSLYLELTKARLSALVLLTTAVGFVLATPMSIDWALLGFTMLGTALAAASAAALNQVVETKRDAKMNRTRHRPIPSGAMSRAHAFTAGVLMGYAGVAILGLFVNLFAAGLALLTIALYVLIYTPLKVRSTLNTIIGAVCGAIPPMIGWVAVTGSLDDGAWVLAMILFVWQLPHFLALAWLYRDDYQRGGYVMLPLVDPRGELTGRVLILTSLILLPLGLMGTTLMLAGWWYAVGSVLLAVWLLALSIVFYFHRTNANARRVFLASIVYLSVLLILFVADRGPVQSGTLLAANQVHAIE